MINSGTCAEGHSPLQSCPFYGRPSETDEEEQNTLIEEGIGAIPKGIALDSGEFLTSMELDAFLRWKPVTLVSIVGSPDSGKTTLLCSVYERFLKGPFADHLFAGSRTIIGFEKRSHESRVASERSTPETPRTTISEGLKFGHLALARRETPSVHAELMISDRAGEVFSQIRSNPDRVTDLTELQKAHVIVLLLDGKRLADPTQRAGGMQFVRQLLRVVIDRGIFGLATNIQVVTTKIDLVDNSAERALVRSHLESFKTNLTRDFSSKVAELTYWEIAARDPLGQFAPAYGLRELISDWMRPRNRALKSPRLQIAVNSERDKFLKRAGIEILP